MHVEDDVHVIFRGPADDAIHEAKAFVVAGREEFVVEGNADGIEAGVVEKLDIVLGDVGVAILIPELRSFFGTDELVDEVFNLARRLRAVVELEHVAFLLEPVAEVGAFEMERRTVGGNEVAAVGVDEL